MNSMLLLLNIFLNVLYLSTLYQSVNGGADFTYLGGCSGPPIAPLYSRLRCNPAGCRGNCDAGYSFPHGETMLKIYCFDGAWKVIEADYEGIPDCSQNCMVKCLNGGICVGGTKCKCVGEFTGTFCEIAVKSCTPPSTTNSQKSRCTSTNCMVTCSEDYEFSDGSKNLEFMCVNGEWTSLTSRRTKPTCQPICNPPCQNEGICEAPNKCKCTSQFTGSYCEYNKDVCDTKNLFFNGRYDCHSTDSAVTCILTCPNGTFANTEIEPSYTCKFSEGKFFPTNVPLCLKKPEEDRPILAITPVGTCFTWSGTNYKTFKGKLFFFRSSCAHILLEDLVDSTFSIIIQNSKFCSKDSCSKILKIFYDEKEYVLKQSEYGTPVFTYSDKVLAVPGKVPGIRVEMVTHYLVVNLDTVGVKIKWNGQQYIEVEAALSLWDKIGGLCGTYKGSTLNDMITKDGLVTKNVETFVNSWQSDSENCTSTVVVDNECGNRTFRTSKELEATTYCKSVLSDSGFAPCKEVLNIKDLVESCVLSYCSCKNKSPKECLCHTFTMYARECTSKGITDLKQWRDAHTCPMPCTGGKVYQLCAPEGGIEVCGGATESIDSGSTCEEGCYCPAGTVLHNFRCISKDDCPCTYHGRNHRPGSTITKKCNSCTCDKGKWNCTNNICSACCSSVGDPHYVTFDGKRYDFMGHCTYYLVKQENYSISAENVACTGEVDVGLGLPMTLQDELPSCTKAVILDINGHTFKFKQNLEITIDGKDITKIPITFDGVTVRLASSQFIIVELPDGVTIRWDGIARAYVDAPPSLFGKTQGLCGTFNNNQKDDFLTPEGDIEQNEVAFGNKWKTDETCPDYPLKQSKHPCEKNVQKKAAAQKSCKVMKSKVFSDCHWDVDPEPFYQECLYDMCSCEFKPARCLCPMIAQYAAECTRHGITVDWRGQVKGCGIACKGGQKYQVCASPCARTCSQIASSSLCISECVEGCNCPDGEAMNGNEECIPISQCECEKDGVKYPAGYKEIRVVDSNKLLCTCTNAQWKCSPCTPGDDIEYPHEEDNKNKCQDDNNREFTLCEPTEPATCKNMHDANEITPSVCQPGCKCKEGYVLDTVSKKCVKPTDCPCYHGGQSYVENAVITNDCNNCTCQSGKWICSKEECPAECSAWGDSHFQTYDGKMYSFQGQCDYVLSKGEVGNDRSFQIAIQNVPCGSFGVTCSKSLTITAFVTPEKETVTLDQDKSVPKSTKLLLIREISNYVFVEIPELGVTVTWDKGTRVYVKLSTLWKNKVKGLCGNYNDNSMDDFQTPAGGFTEISSQIFGDSWRLQPYCSEAIDVTNTCDDRPNRKMWALRKCGILKSPVFAKCHVEVSVEPFLQNCIFDTCACDQGGDCECLCTALAAYAHECSIKGVHIKWRTPKLCPMQCDERCSNYHPCISTCPVETCENTVIYKTLSQSCQNDICVEGCKAKECEPGFIFLNSEMLECVPKNVCKPSCIVIEGRTYYEGELIEKDDCHSCYCSRGKKHCQGQPCITLPTPKPEVDKCVPGWTNWINRNVNDKLLGKFTDIEPLPSTSVMNTLRGIRCNEDMITAIECRTVSSHISAGATGLNVECSLEKGLVCLAVNNTLPCPDFEIRVQCSCGDGAVTTRAQMKCDLNDESKLNIKDPNDCHSFYHCMMQGDGEYYVKKSCGNDMMYNPKKQTCDFPNVVVRIREECEDAKDIQPIAFPISITKPLVCPKGEVYDTCAIKCTRLCSYYEYITQISGRCQNNQECHEGCVSILDNGCPEGMFWTNAATCVKKQDCMCISFKGKPVKPGEIVKESDCTFCQCIDNYYACDDSTCETNLTGSIGVTTLAPRVTKSTLIIPQKVTPPLACNEQKYIDLIDATSLGDDAFSASSTLSEQFSPKHARLGSSLPVNSWVPKTTNAKQFLQINLGRQEAIYGVVVQGNPIYNKFVTSYYILYTLDGHAFSYVTDADNKPKLFRGCIDSKTPIKQLFDAPIEAHIIRFNPRTWYNQIAMKVGVIGCSEFSMTPKPIQITQKCTEPMGIDNGLMYDSQISVSSELKPHHTKNQLKLSRKFGWQPITNSPYEWVMFDFIELHTLTGIEIKGGPYGWVTAFNARYSSNGKDWNILLGDDSNEKTLLGNVDEHTPTTVSFGLPIQAQFLKIIPIQWHRNIQLRLEVLGCYTGYPTPEEKVTQKPTTCNVCPDVTQTTRDCKCEQDLWWDGTNCVARVHCPCVYRSLTYPVEGIFQKEDCSQCLCKLGGISHCTPKVCDKCQEGLLSLVTTNCHCVCQPCPTGTRLCPTSNICINETSWCNGVRDCPDDETDCEAVPVIEEVVHKVTVSSLDKKPPKRCPEFRCSQGYRVVVKSSYEHTKGATKSNAKSFTKLPTGAKEGIKSPYKQCKEYECVPSLKSCTKPTCSEGYKVKLAYTKQTNECPKYRCAEKVPEEDVCSVTGRTFNTFDSTEYKYEICNHVLARDFVNYEWQIKLEQVCRESCTRKLVLDINKHEFVFGTDLSIEYNKYKFDVDQMSQIAKRRGFFTIKLVGECLNFVSLPYGFWIHFDTQGNVRIGISKEHLHEIDGLCGYYSEKSSDDKRTPNGEIAKNTAEFGNSWAIGKQPETCATKACPPHVQMEAWKLCNLVQEQVFAPCRDFIDVEDFLSTCLETTCACLEEGTTEAKTKCKCLALQNFAVQCLKENQDTVSLDWRVKYECPVVCEAPFVYYDCYKRECEPRCGSSIESSCPIVDKACYPGCYCPLGYVRKGNKCVLPSDCGDCQCTLLPNLDYVTYDDAVLTINGNCTYIMSEDEKQKFQVLITNMPCLYDPSKGCIEKITIIYNDHKTVISKKLPENVLQITVNDKIVTDYDSFEEWMSITYKPYALELNLHKTKVKITIHTRTLALIIVASSNQYGGRLQGLCGDCNGDDTNDLRKPNGELTKDVNEFGTSWVYGDDQNADKCLNKPEEECKEIAKDKDSCSVLLDEEKFGQCHQLLDTKVYEKWCKRDSCNAANSSCDAIQTYAYHCAWLGICVDWRSEFCPAKQCPPGLQYKPCAPGCPQTCEALKHNTECSELPLEGCFCPEGKVLLKGTTCVTPDQCEVCDDEGHHPGDKWSVDACTTCTCDARGVKCEKQNCPSYVTVCQPGFEPVRIPNYGRCCDVYVCMPKPPPKCETPKKIPCSKDQILKLVKDGDCDEFVCQCKPLEECDPISTEPLEEGLVRVVDKSGCCPIAKDVCKKELCSRPPNCPLYYVFKKIHVPEKCCQNYECEPPQGKCVVDLEYTAEEKGGERKRTIYEKQTVLKDLNEEWQDGPCRSCKCIVKNNIGASLCTVIECPILPENIDHEEYVLKPESVPGQCCLGVKKTACKHNGKVYKAGETWTVEGDYCTSMECIQDGTDIRKHTKITYCNEECKVGWTYEPPEPSARTCCGTCKHVACVVDDVLHKEGASWSSEDHCTNYFCINVNGSLHVKTVMVQCTEPHQDVLDNYVIDVIPVEGECCPNNEIVACKEGQKKYLVGDVWPSPDGNKCIQYSCIKIETGIVKHKTIESCNENCHLGWKYEPSSTKCCGSCVQIGCVVKNQVKNMGDTWTSSDGCVTYICDRVGDQFSVITQEKICPDMSDCPLENVYLDGCCKFCNISIASLVTCHVSRIPPLKTIGLISSIYPPHGVCVNKQPLTELTECSGACASSTSYSSDSSKQESACTCCQALKNNLLSVEFECKDGYKFKKQISVPNKCGCLKCRGVEY